VLTRRITHPFSSRSSPAPERLPLGHAAALGLLQGPTELLPVSSSAHTTLVPLLAGWPYGELDPRLRKSFEVALHAGAGLALAIELREEIAWEALHLDRRRASVIALSLGPPALAGLVLHRAIERRLGGPRSIAAGLIGGSLALTLGERRRAPGTRVRADARALDGLALGLAQTAALMPGVSRSGATLTAARLRGFTRADAQALSWHAALPVILGASVLTGARLARDGAPAGSGGALSVGGGTAFASTLASTRILRSGAAGRSPLGFSVYRCLLALLVLRRRRAGAQ
jgi:undecaprenyl-diphosphatase